MRVPQFLPYIGNDEYRAIASCFEANWITEGPKAKEFSEKLLQLTGAKYGVFAPNGTLALYLALKAAGIRPGDHVIVPDFTFIGTANAVEMAGAIPVFADVNRKNFQVDMAAAQQLVSPDVKAIIPVHIYGTAANMDEIMPFAKTHNLAVIEDAAQAIGVRYKGKHTGTFGHAGCFSFFADKTITTGEGGYIVTNDEKIYNNLLFLRNQGRKDRGTFIHPEIGYNFRMTDIQCAIGLMQLTRLEKIAQIKKEVFAQYKNLLSPVEEIDFFIPEANADFIPFRVGILCKKAHELMDYMKQRGIEPRTFFYPLHLQPCYTAHPHFEHMKGNSGSFPNTVFGYEHGICLPTFASITTEQINLVCNTIKAFYEEQ
jgi:perosamine synthetase